MISYVYVGLLRSSRDYTLLLASSTCIRQDKDHKSMVSRLSHRRPATVRKIFRLSRASILSIISLVVCLANLSIIKMYSGIVNNNGSNLAKSDSSAKANRIPLHDGLIKAYPPRNYGAPDYWSDVLREGESLNKEMQEKGKETYLDIIEVGANDARQAREIRSHGFNAHSFEPSPKSYTKMEDALSKDETNGIYLYNAAVGDSDGISVKFTNNDSTGAQVVLKGEDDNAVEVKMVTIDSFLRGNIAPDFGGAGKPVIQTAGNANNHIFAAKIDVQGFEPNVFRGMKGSIQKRKIHYIMTEFWPKGINSMNGYSSKCENAVEFLCDLHNAGYSLFAAPIEAHPKSDPNGREQTAANKLDRRFDDLKEDCLWLHRLEQKYPSQTNWSMGYWTDVFAVAPEAPLSSNSTTRFGKAMQAFFGEDGHS